MPYTANTRLQPLVPTYHTINEHAIPLLVYCPPIQITISSKHIMSYRFPIIAGYIARRRLRSINWLPFSPLTPPSPPSSCVHPEPQYLDIPSSFRFQLLPPVPTLSQAVLMQAAPTAGYSTARTMGAMANC